MEHEEGWNKVERGQLARDNRSDSQDALKRPVTRGASDVTGLSVEELDIVPS